MPRPLGGWGMLGSERSVLSIGAVEDDQLRFSILAHLWRPEATRGCAPILAYPILREAPIDIIRLDGGPYGQILSQNFSPYH